MKIHWLGPYLPERGRSGSDLRSFHLIKALKKAGHTLRGTFQGVHSQEAEPFFDSVDFVEPSRVMRYLRAAGGWFGGIPLSVGRFYHPEFWPSTEGLDWIYLDHLHMAVNIPSHCDIPIWLDEHNLEFRLWEEYTEELSALIKPFGSLEAKTFFQYEMETLEQVTGFGLPSEVEQNILPDELSSKSMVIPNGVDSEWLRRGKQRIRSSIESIEVLGFVGGFDWRPNRQGIEKFLNNYWGKLRSDFPSVKLLLAGRSPDSAWKRYPGVETLGFVSNMDEFYQQIDLMVVPLEYGAGTRVKVLEAMARGVPVRGTAKAVEGIRGPENLGNGTIEELYTRLQRDLKNPRPLMKLRDRCYHLVEDHYKWDEIGETLCGALGDRLILNKS